MSLIRWSPRNDVTGLDLFDNFFSPDVVGKPVSFDNQNWLPNTDVVEEKDKYLVKVELPGLDKKDVDIKVEDNILSISGERKEEKEEKDARYHRIERRYGSFVRSFRLPETVNQNAIEASFKNGVLTVQLPKSEKAIPKAIEVKVK